MALVVRMIKGKWITPPKPVQDYTSETYEGRTVIVTGATSGIGVEAAYKFAALGAAKVILTARDLEKGKSTHAALQKRLGQKDVLEVWQLDLGSYESVVAFAKRANTLNHLDIAVLNAGTHRSSYAKSKHGWEEDIQVNALSTTLLGILLLPKLKQSRQHTGKPAVLEFVNSGLHQDAIVPNEVRQDASILEWYNKPENFGEHKNYKFSKVFLMYATNKLAEEVSPNEVLITSVCPGIVWTDLGRDHYFPGIHMLLWVFTTALMRAPSQGANTLLSGTVQGEKIHGRFWKDDSIFPIAQSLSGDENKKLGLRIWNEIAGILKRDVPTVTEALDSIVQK